MKNTKAREEIPDTEQGLIVYIEYCKGQIHRNKLHSKRLETRMKWCIEDLEKIKKSKNNNQTDLENIGK